MPLIKPHDVKDLGLILCNKRRNLRLTLMDIERNYGLTKPTIVSLEKGRGGYLHTLIKYLWILGIDLKIDTKKQHIKATCPQCGCTDIKTELYHE